MFVNAVYKLLIFPGFLFTAALGLASSFFDRKMTARLQWRVGPPWYQPLADLLKLLGKEMFIPEGATPSLFILSPMAGLASAALVSTMLWAVNMDRSSTFIGDLIVAIYLMMMPSIALIVGGLSSNNPFASAGASREMKLILAYELPFIIATFTVIAKAGSLLFGKIIEYQISNGMMIGHASSLIAFAVMILSSQAKLGIAPFDIAEAEQELAGGPTVEYSGALLAIIKLTRAMMLAVIPVFLITLFFGGIDLSSGWAVLHFALKYIFILLLITLIKNTNPRLRIDQAVRFFWGPIVVLAVFGFVLAMFGA